MRLVEFINAAKSARLSPADTLLLGSACPDILSTIAFSVSEGELSPSMDEIRKQLGRSISSGSVLATRLSSDPLSVGFPYRVSVDATPESLFVEAGTNCSFDEVLATLAELTQHKVDPFIQSGRVHVFRNVSGAPGGSPLSTIVTLQLNHSFADGRGAARILRGILSAATGPVEAASLGSAPTVVHSESKSWAQLELWRGLFGAQLAHPRTRVFPPAQIPTRLQNAFVMTGRLRSAPF
jgi:hypothetical protein